MFQGRWWVVKTIWDHTCSISNIFIMILPGALLNHDDEVWFSAHNVTESSLLFSTNDQFLVQSAQFCFRSSTEATIYPLVEAPHYHPPCHHLASVSTTNCHVYDAVYRINSHNTDINNFNIQSGKNVPFSTSFLRLPITSKNTFSMLKKIIFIILTSIKSKSGILQANADIWRQRQSNFI